jgi:hypothetical protein
MKDTERFVSFVANATTSNLLRAHSPTTPASSSTVQILGLSSNHDDLRFYL